VYFSTFSFFFQAVQALKELTRFNTDFNSVAANLMKDAPSTSTSTPARNFTSLKLGKPLTDSEGKRRTLLVSVQPFGDKSSPVKITNEKKPSTNGTPIPVAEEPPQVQAPLVQATHVQVTAPPATAPTPPPVASPKQMFLKSIVEPEEPPTIIIKPLIPAAAAPTTESTPKTTQGRPEKRTHITRATPITKNNEVLLKTKLILTSKNDEKAKIFGRENNVSDVKVMPTILPRLKVSSKIRRTR